MKLLKICISEWENESRDKRELDVAKELGIKVEVLAKGDETGKIECVDGFSVYRVTTVPLKKINITIINRIVSIFIWIKCARQRKPDIISGHDVFALLIGYLSNIGRKNKAKLVYDSHEFELGRIGNRNCISRLVIKNLERFLINKSVFSIMVSNLIADEVQNIYRLKDKPTVVRNIPNFFNMDNCNSKQKREEIISEMNWSKDSFIIIYHGKIANGRGIEQLIDVLSVNDKVCGIILGNDNDKNYLKQIKNKASFLKVINRLYISPAVNVNEMYKMISAADLGFVLIQNVCKSYFYSLPNKLFENIQALTPVLSSDFPEMKNIVEGYKIGLTCNPDNIENINECIIKFQNDREFYNDCKSNIAIAKEVLCWEKEKDNLVKAYKKVI